MVSVTRANRRKASRRKDAGAIELESRKVETLQSVAPDDRAPGFLKGKIWIGRDFDDPLPSDILDAFEGRGK
jgi:hypothetical protein